jgi:hypothetical protein
VSTAAVRYDNGLTVGALTLYEAIALEQELASTSAFGLASMFNDGSWSMQGGLHVARRSAPVVAATPWHALFTSLRSEVSLSGGSTMQSGFMPTLHLIGNARVLFDHDRHGARIGAGVTRTFDGRFWQSAVLAEGSAWVRRGDAEFSLTSTPMQLGIGDIIGDTEAGVEWTHGRSVFGAALGLRVGESQRGTVGWGSFSVTWPVREDLWTSVSLGSYPADLLQGLPGGRYAAFTMRLPNGRLPSLRRRPPPIPPPPAPLALPITERLAIVIGTPLDSADLREIRVRAPGATTVELLADFVDWIPVPLIRQPDGDWRGYYRVPRGLHRLSLRIDGQESDVPTNIGRARDVFLGAVGLIMVR